MHTHPRFGKDRWEERLGGRTVTAIETHGKNLFIVFDNGLLLHSHLRMTGAWDVRPVGGRWRRAPRRAWLVLRAGDREAVEYDGPVLELLTSGRRRFDQRLRSTDPQRTIGEALLDQRILAGIGNLWKAESCWEAQVDPWRAVASLSDEQAVALVEGIRPRMLISGTQGMRAVRALIYRRVGQPCPRCRTPIVSRGQGDENRTTYWCPGCQH
jgi:endonuclease-8